MRKAAAITAALAVFAVGAPVGHADPLARAGEPDRKAEQEFKEGVDKLIRAFQLMLRAVPQYEAPEVLDNGDIIIRRRPPRAPAERDRLLPHRWEWT